MLMGLLNIGISELEFHIEDGVYKSNEEDLKRLAVCLNSPWSQTDERYTIEYNCKNSYTKKDDCEPAWKCEYEVVSNEEVTSIIYGFGNTQQEALINCIANCDALQKEFNKENKSF